MDAYVRTRGGRRLDDYRFLGPPRAKWWDTYRRWTRAERPAFFLCADAEGWRLFADGVESGRSDSEGVPIRFGVELVGGPADAEGARRFAHCWFADVTGRGTPTLAPRFDEVFPEPVVTTLYRAAPADAAEQVRAGTMKLLATLPPAPASASVGTSADGSWMGCLYTAADRADFLSRVDVLLAGAVGDAAYLNDAYEDDWPEGSPDGRPVVLLVEQRISRMPLTPVDVDPVDVEEAVERTDTDDGGADPGAATDRGSAGTAGGGSADPKASTLVPAASRHQPPATRPLLPGPVALGPIVLGPLALGLIGLVGVAVLVILAALLL